MTRDELVQEIRDALGYNEGFSAAKIVLALQYAQDELELRPESPWFLESEITTTTTTADEERVALPDNFIRFMPESALWYSSGTAPSQKHPIRIMSIKQLRETGNIALGQAIDNVSGYPQFAALQGKYLRLYPVPDDVYTLELIYVKKDDVLTAGSSENGWAKNAPECLKWAAVQRICLNSRDATGEQLASKQLAAAWVTLHMQSEAREHSGKVYVRGGDD